uniref:Uncharacterized protein n=1 Tax=Mycena chlorophos TaxID=658473 RepID=A0ABQ0M412_MYCCL|nr:predicted protein [Mycena chlorophos]
MANNYENAGYRRFPEMQPDIDDEYGFCPAPDKTGKQPHGAPLELVLHTGERLGGLLGYVCIEEEQHKSGKFMWHAFARGALPTVDRILPILDAPKYIRRQQQLLLSHRAPHPDDQMDAEVLCDALGLPANPQTIARLAALPARIAASHPLLLPARTPARVNNHARREAVAPYPLPFSLNNNPDAPIANNATRICACGSPRVPLTCETTLCSKHCPGGDRCLFHREAARRRKIKALRAQTNHRLPAVPHPHHGPNEFSVAQSEPRQNRIHNPPLHVSRSAPRPQTHATGSRAQVHSPVAGPSRLRIRNARSPVAGPSRLRADSTPPPSSVTTHLAWISTHFALYLAQKPPEIVPALSAEGRECEPRSGPSLHVGDTVEVRDVVGMSVGIVWGLQQREAAGRDSRKSESAGKGMLSKHPNWDDAWHRL